MSPYTLLFEEEEARPFSAGFSGACSGTVRTTVSLPGEIVWPQVLSLLTRISPELVTKMIFPPMESDHPEGWHAEGWGLWEHRVLGPGSQGFI